MQELAPDVAVLPLKIANVYFVGDKDRWFLVDTGLSGEAAPIRKAAGQRFGPDAKPAAIVLTHGHPDHSGSAWALAEGWNVPIYAPRLEMPFLSGRSQYPPPDPTVPGVLAFISRFIPSASIDLGQRLAPLNENEPFPGLTGWQTIPTAGHTPGHSSYYRASDGLLLAGDAFATMDLESLVGILTKKPKLTRPPAPSTTNWAQAKESLVRLAQLAPILLAPGHGKPLPNIGNRLQAFADSFSIPAKGRYVNSPVTFGETGVVTLPPAPPDPLMQIGASLVVAGVALGLGAVYPKVRSRLLRKS